jgi:hypothetical protein
LHAHLAHQAPHAFVSDRIPVRAERGGHSGPAIERRFEILRIDLPHQLQIERVFRRWLVIIGGAVETEQGALPADAEFGMIGLDEGTFLLNRTGQLFLTTPAPS